mmetsp:Transcript_8420/g.24144  ORF Transcript_8420/g.24144 Transcript_8420/m.24144 type:complete len:236 (+) Transcript_8420:345-1052(+)
MECSNVCCAVHEIPSPPHAGSSAISCQLTNRPAPLRRLPVLHDDFHRPVADLGVEPVVKRHERLAHKADPRYQVPSRVILVPGLILVVRLRLLAQDLSRLSRLRQAGSGLHNQLEALCAVPHLQWVLGALANRFGLFLLHILQSLLVFCGKLLAVPRVPLHLLHRYPLPLIVLKEPLDQVLAVLRDEVPHNRDVPRLPPHVVELLPPNLLELALKARVLRINLHLKGEEPKQHHK